MNLQEFMAYYKEGVEKELKRFFLEKKREVENKFSREVVKTIEEYTLRGGKRLRAILMILGYKMFGGEGEEIVRAASSLELVQSYLLIHDDIMDESELRRGKKTVHRIYEEKHLKNGFGGNPRRFGENMGIITGDLANAYAFEILTRSDFPDNLKIRAINYLNKVIEYTGYGQIIDVYSSLLESFTENDLLLLHKYKTAKYTIEGPLAMGAILAGGEYSEIEKFAIPVGIAFQLKDDVLGLFGNEERIGKPVTSDLAEGKKTLLIIKALEEGDENDRMLIMNALGNPAVTEEQLEEVRNVVRKTGALDYSERMAEKLINDGKKSLREMEVKNEEMKGLLLQLADYMIKRNY